AVLGDLDALRARVAATLAGLDADVDRLEPGDTQVVAGERRRARVLARGPRGPQRARGHIPAHRPPDLPIGAEGRPEVPVAARLDRGVARQIAHRDSVPPAKRPPQTSFAQTPTLSVSRAVGRSVAKSGGAPTLMRGTARSSHFGSHQLALPSSSIVAGTSTMRTMLASMKIAVASPRPSSL